MVTTRIPINRRQQQKVHITPEMLTAWLACKQIKRRGQKWEDARNALLKACSLSKFGPAPCDAEPLYSLIGATKAELDYVRRLRAALEQADREAAGEQ
jgi:hypothetical protein